MKTPLRLIMLGTLAASFVASSFADQLVITLRDGKTIVLDTEEIVSMSFVGSGNTVQLVPSPKNFTEANRPPGAVTVTFRPVRAPGGNLAMAATMTNGLPGHRYEVYLFVDGRNLMKPVPLITDRAGNGHCSGRFQLPPGDRVLAVSIANPNSERDLFVTSGIYQKTGTSVTIDPPGQGFPGRPRR